MHAIVMASCNVCDRKVLRHSYQMKCTLCNNRVHLNCLPSLTKADSLYIERETNNWYCYNCTAYIFPFNHLTEQDDFINALAENYLTESCMSLHFIQSNDRVFQPFELNVDADSPLSDIDPDLQYYHNQYQSNISCDYYLEDSFNKRISSLNIDKRSFSLIHSNIRSIPKNLKRLEHYLDNLDLEFSIIALSETWLKDHSVDLYDLNGYSSEHNYRKSRSGGGVSLYIKDSIEYSIRDDLCSKSHCIESLFIEIDKNQINKTKNAIVGVIYRPPDTDLKSFNEQVQELLSSVHLENKTTYCLGDFNINLLNIETHSETHEFTDAMFSFSLIPTITKPTRVTSKSATLIDNIFTSSISNDHVFNGILYTDITDHFPIFYIDNSEIASTQPLYFKRRVYNDENKDRFNRVITNEDWTNVLDNNDPQEAYTLFFKKILQCL